MGRSYPLGFEEDILQLYHSGMSMDKIIKEKHIWFNTLKKIINGESIRINEYIDKETYYEVTANSSKGKVIFFIDKEDGYVTSINGTWYFSGNGLVNSKGQLLHRIIINPPQDLVVDHINGNVLDNRKSNLRCANKSQNGQNRKGANSNSTTGIRGVSWDFARNKWAVRVRQYKGKYLFGGRYDSIEEAEKAAIELRLSIMPFTAQENLECLNL